MSAPCAAALAIVDGGLAAHQFLPDSVQRPAVRRLIDLAAVNIDPECERIYPQRRSGAVSVTLQNGQTVQMRILDPKGEGDHPMTDADLEQKFLVNCTPLIDAVRGQRLLEAIWNFDQMRDSQELFDWLQP